jgi:hypothetical protein
VERYKLIVAGMARGLVDRDTVSGAEPEDLMCLDIPALDRPGRDAFHATSAARYLEECLPRAEYLGRARGRADGGERAGAGAGVPGYGERRRGVAEISGCPNLFVSRQLSHPNPHGFGYGEVADPVSSFGDPESKGLSG